MNNPVAKVGVLLVIAGVVVMGAPVFGYDVLGLDRSFQLSVAEDERNALLGIEATYDSDDTIEYETGFFGFPVTETSAELVELKNNVDDAYEIDVEVASVTWDSRSDADVLTPVESTQTLESGQRWGVQLECSGDVAGEADSADVTLDVTATSPSISVDRRSYSVSGVSFSCEGDRTAGGEGPDDVVPIEETQLSLVDDSVSAETSTGASPEPGSRVTFDVQNDGSDEVVVSEISVSETTSDANEVYYCAAYTFFPPGCTDTDAEAVVAGTTTGSVNVDEAIAIGADAPTYALDTDATVEAGDVATVSLEQFREDGFNSQVDMSGTDLTVMLVVDDPNGEDGRVGVVIDLSIP